MFNRRELLRKTPVVAIATILGLSSLVKVKAEDSEGDFNREENFLDWAASLRDGQYHEVPIPKKESLKKSKILYAHQQDGEWFCKPYGYTGHQSLTSIEKFYHKINRTIKAHHFGNDYYCSYVTLKGQKALKIINRRHKDGIVLWADAYYFIDNTENLQEVNDG